MAKCKRWLVACSHEFFTEKKITRNAYICALHWPGEKGPTAEFPDPMKANLRPAQVSGAHAPKRKAPKISFENIVQDAALMKHFTGLRPSQFEVLHDFLDDVCSLEIINYWKSKDCPATENARTGPKADFSSREKRFICLLKLKRGFTLNTVAALLSTPNRKINFSYIGKIFTTYIQLM